MHIASGAPVEYPS